MKVGLTVSFMLRMKSEFDMFVKFIRVVPRAFSSLEDEEGFLLLDTNKKRSESDD